MLLTKPCPDAQYAQVPSHDADSRATLRTGVHRIYLPAPFDASPRVEMQTRLSSRFNLILWVLYTGMQWKCMPIPRAADGTALIHYTTIYKVFAKWADDGSLEQAFIASVRHLAEHHQLDLNILHGDGTNTVAKKGGDGIGYSGHKHQRGEKIIAIVDNNGFVLAPLPVAPVNQTDTIRLPWASNRLPERPNRCRQSCALP